MPYLSKTCVSTKKILAGLAHKKYLKKLQIVKRNCINKKQQTYVPSTAYLSRSDLISKCKQCRSNNTEIYCSLNRVL